LAQALIATTCKPHHPKGVRVNRIQVTETIISTQIAKSIKWEDVARKVGLSKEWITAACLGQMMLNDT
jgi:cyanate lyase